LYISIYDVWYLEEISVERFLLTVFGNDYIWWITGFGDRLESEMTKLVKKNATRSQRNLKVRVIPSSSHREAGYTSQRKTAAWIGGSIISSLDTFKQIKITRQEWEEDPDACVRTKFV